MPPGGVPGRATPLDSLCRVPPARQLTRVLAAVTLATAPLLAFGGTAGATSPARARAADAAVATPLSVRLTSLAPSVIPRKGMITLTGLVANGSPEKWTDVNVAPFVSADPITTREELSTAAATDPADTVGSRLDDPSTYVPVGDLDPGQAAPFRIRVPRDSLRISGAAGVYWIGVHALGSNADGRDLVADGRARTFIPLVPTDLAKRQSTDVSLVLPFRDRARRAADGSLNGPARWVSLTGTNGRLSRLADLAASAGPTPVTWELDPAVLDALEDFSHGNPALSLGSAQVAAPAPSPSPSSSPSASASAAPSTGDSASASPSVSAAQRRKQSLPTDPARTPPSQAERERAGSTLSTFVDAVRSKTLLTMPYADPDAASLARRRASLLSRAQDLSAQRMRARDLSGTPSIAPPDGLFDTGLLGRVRRSTLFVLGDQGSSRGRSRVSPFERLEDGQPLVLSDDLASGGGPAPTSAYDILAVRQRILADAALELTTGERRPLVVRFPSTWDPGAEWRQADLFGGLSTPWLRLVPVLPGGTRTYDGDLPYGRAQRAAEIGDANVAATRSLVRTAGVLGDLLASANDVRDRLTGAALEGSAYSARPTRSLAAEQVSALETNVRQRMGRVQVTGIDPVTLSGGSGSLTVTLVNGLAQPITVGLKTRTDNPAVHVASADPVAMGPGERMTVRLRVRSEPGLHVVSMYPVTSRGEPAGTPLTFNLRTSQVGQVIWYVMIGGGALLLVMIVRRIVLRIRHRSWRVEEGA